MVSERRLDVLLGGDDQLRALGQQLQQLAEVLDGQQLGDVGPVLVGGRDLGQLAVLGRELGGGRDLDELGLPQAALGEGGEPAQRLDLDVEEVDADGALLGGGVDVEQAAADRELPAVLDLVDAVVAGGDELLGGLVEVEQVADSQDEAVRAQLGVRDLLRERGGADHDDGLLGALGRVGQRVERRHSEPDQVRRRRQVGLVGDAAARVVADRPRRQPGAQVEGEITRRAVVADDDQRRALRVLVGERRDHERPQRLADVRGAALVGELGGGGVVLEVAEKGSEQPFHSRRAIVLVMLTETVFELFGEPVTWAELAGFVTGIACVALAVFQRIETFRVGIANNVFFIVLFMDARLYADAALQVVYIALAVMGWWVLGHAGARAAWMCFGLPVA